MWKRTTKGNTAAVALADRHYSRQTPGGQVGQPGRCIVLIGEDCKSLLVWQWPYARFARHGYGDRFVCSLFRNECLQLSSAMIIAAEGKAVEVWGEPPEGWLTFVDADKVRRKRDPGRCFIKAGYRRIGITTKGLIVLGKS